jgi:hypothetical protein
MSRILGLRLIAKLSSGEQLHRHRVRGDSSRPTPKGNAGKRVGLNQHPDPTNMLRTITLAAAAALLASAASAQSITISTRGKSADQLKAEVAKAADKLCYQQTVGASFPIDAQQHCVATTVKKTLAQAPGLGQSYAQR